MFAYLCFGLQNMMIHVLLSASTVEFFLYATCFIFASSEIMSNLRLSVNILLQSCERPLLLCYIPEAWKLSSHTLTS